MPGTVTEIVAPAYVRGDLIAKDLVTFGGRDGIAAFRAPDPRGLRASLALRDPGRLRELQQLPFEEIVAYLDALGAELDVERNAHLQEAIELSALFSDL